MAKAIWSGSISFGLVNIPVKLYTATRDKSVHFHQLHQQNNVRVQQKLYCPAEDKEISRDELVKGYEFAPNQYVVVQPEELESLEPEKSRTIDISDFVDIGQIDPVYYDTPYYLVPDENATKAYALLAEAMAKAGKVGIAKFVMRNREYLAALRPVNGAICVEIMRFADEVVPVQELQGLPKRVEVPEKQLKLAQQLIDSLAGDFDPEKYKDEYRQRVQELVHKKIEGQEIVVQPPEEVPAGKVIDLMSALQQSLERAKGKRKKTA